jgi:hypothetical protein
VPRLSKALLCALRVARPVRKDEKKRRTALRPDGVAWQFDPAGERVVAVGDLHGDILGLFAVLLDRGLVDVEGRWTGGRAHLVLTGDLVGGRDSRLLIELVMRLTEEAARAGGAVHALLGNRDLAVLDPASDSSRLRRLLERYAPAGTALPLHELFRGSGPHARWLRQRNAIVAVGPTLFVHAGLDRAAAAHHPARLNATIRAWLRCWQGAGREPPATTRWTVQARRGRRRRRGLGPLFTRALKPRRDQRPARRKRGLRRTELAALLARHGTGHMVVGHTPATDAQILLHHPYYGPLVQMIDTRISDRQRGRPSCLEIRSGRLSTYYPSPAAPARQARLRELQRLAARSPAPTSSSRQRVLARLRLLLRRPA